VVKILQGSVVTQTKLHKPC